MEVTITINGTTQSHDVEPRTLLVHYLREHVGLTGTNVGCDTSSCGACTVQLDGESVKCCTVLAVQADGADDHHDRGPGRPTASCTRCSRRSMENHGLQCGYCTPGMVMAAVSACSRRTRTRPSSEVRIGLEGNLCRCTGYHNIVKAVLAAAGVPAQRRASVIPAAFDYVRADSAEEAISLARPSTATTPSSSPAATACCR